MKQTITFEFDSQFADDLASLGIEYVPNETDDSVIDVTVNKWNIDSDLFGLLDTNCQAWY